MNKMKSQDSFVDGSGHVQFIDPALVMLDEKGRPTLIVGRCTECGHRSFPKGAICAQCLSQNVETVTAGGPGKLYSFSIVHQAPKGWSVPYALGYVDLPDDIRTLAHLDVPLDKIAIDMEMKLSVGVVGSGSNGEPLYSYTFVAA